MLDWQQLDAMKRTAKRKNKMENHKEMVRSLIECFGKNSPDVNADIARAAVRDANQGNTNADAIVEACFMVEFGNTGAADFLAMILQEQNPLKH